MTVTGLTTERAQAILRADGPNTLPEPERRGRLRIAIEVLREPMLALLVLSGLIYLVIGELSDALILLVFALLSVVITVVQEIRTERVLQSLRSLTAPKALVIRNGLTQRIEGSDVVRGDVIVLREGDRVPADAIVRDCSDLQVDESLLTGESVPVRKRVAVASDGLVARPGGDDLPHVFSGTLVVRGDGLAEVVTTGVRSEIGKIGRSLGAVQSASPKLQSETRRLTLTFGLLGAAVSVAAVLLYGLLRHHWLNAVLAGIALGMSMLPEEFPVVVTVFMAMGAWRISKARVLTRRSSAIEALGSATVLCTDKTGTLTENKMTIAELYLPSGETLTAAEGVPLSRPGRNLIRTGVLASAVDPFDPMERAFHQLAEATSEVVPDTWHVSRTYGLRPGLLAVVQAWETPANGTLTVAAKGAPESIASLCKLQGDELRQMQTAVNSMAERGLRVLGLATGEHPGLDWPETPHGFTFQYLGLVGLIDPVRESVPAAVAQCRTAGIRVVMITGDHPQTAGTIARLAGIDSHAALTGTQLSDMSEGDFEDAVRKCNVFARILPEQKLQIVQALKRSGEIVAMTGDGVNDAPSLKAADIGIAMGGRGTDVAREASSIVLLDDDFDSIVSAIRHGRRIYDNLRKAMAFILAVHVPIAGLALLPLLAGLPVLFWPVHIAFLEMIIDPVCSLVFEAERDEPNIMNRAPRQPAERLLPWRVIGTSALEGLIVLAVASTVFIVLLAGGADATAARATTFITLVGAIFALIITNRSFSVSLVTAFARPSKVLAIVGAFVGAILMGSLFVPSIANIFGFARLSVGQLGTAAVAVVSVLALLELVKSAGRYLRVSRRATLTN
jgi:Ca2+-transporting ATPase